MELARADTLRKAEDQGVIIKAPRGNKTQWHANFKLDEFVPLVRDVPIVQRDGKSGDVLLRGVLNIGPGHTVADGCKMLLTELQMAPIGGESSKHANDSFPHCLALSLSFAHAFVALCPLFAQSAGGAQRSRLPETPLIFATRRGRPSCYRCRKVLLLVGNCEVPRFVDPRFSVGGDPSPVIIRASASS